MIELPSLEEVRDFGRRLTASDFVRKVAETFAARILLIGIGLVTSVIVARILGPSGRGFYAAAAAVTAIGIQFGNLGLHASNTYYVAKDRASLPVLIGNSLLVSFAFGGAAALAAWGVFRVFPQAAPVPGWLLVLALVGVPIGLAYLLMQNLLLGIHEVRAYNAIEIASKVLVVALLGGIIVAGRITASTVYVTSVVGMVLSLAAVMWWLIRKEPRGMRLSMGALKEHVPYGARAYIAALFAFLVLRSDVLIVKYFLGSTQTGLYSIGVSMADLVYMLPVVIGTILFPKLSAVADEREKWKMARSVAIGTLGIMVVLSIVAALAAGPLVRLLYGAEFIPAVPAFNWLLPGIVFLGTNGILMNYFASVGFPMIAVYSPAAATVVNLVLNLVLVPRIGIVGASFASTVAYGLMLAISVVYVSFSIRRRLA